MSPRVDPDERRAEIMQAALRCFARSGYKGTSMDDIDKESGLSKGSLYWYFDSKRDLFLEMFDQMLNEMIAPLEAMLAYDAPAVEKLRVIAQASGEVTSQESEILALPVNFLIEIWQEKDFIEHYAGMIGHFADAVEHIIREGIAAGDLKEVDAHEAAWGLMALIDGVLLYKIAGLPGDAGRQITLLFDLIIDGMRKRGDE
jgi:AcrR family transcriptional regulator